MREAAALDKRLMELYARAIEGFCIIHEHTDHEGDLCPDARAGVIAFLAHRIGADIELIAEHLEAFNAEHRKKEQSH